MTEEEIMKQLKKACILDPLCYEVDCLYEEDLQAIRSLVDLYNKQKEELETEKHYAKVYENMVKDYEKICIEKNKKIDELNDIIESLVWQRNFDMKIMEERKNKEKK